jgi:hypothetical protein
VERFTIDPIALREAVRDAAAATAVTRTEPVHADDTLPVVG